MSSCLFFLWRTLSLASKSTQVWENQICMPAHMAGRVQLGTIHRDELRMMSKWTSLWNTPYFIIWNIKPVWMSIRAWNVRGHRVDFISHNEGRWMRKCFYAQSYTYCWYNSRLQFSDSTRKLSSEYSEIILIMSIWKIYILIIKCITIYGL